ncbi:MAG TPA: S41 family peptidase [Bacteroidales bacterium]|nr:S41 family peptidase [Bacteroidales bacterium]
MLCENYIPISVTERNNKLYISSWLDSSINVQQEYREILGIDSTPVSEIMSVLRNKISTDGNNEVSKLFNLQSEFHILYNKFYPCKPQYILELGSGSGDIQNLIVKAINRKEIMKQMNGPKEEIETGMTENGSYYIRLPTFYTKELKSNNINYRSYIKDFFREVKNKSGKEIIIDIRGNRGGSVHMAGYLASFIIDSTFTFFNSVELNNTSRITFDKYIIKDPFYRFRKIITQKRGAKRYYTFHRELRARKPNRFNPGKSVTVKVLIDPTTFSAATMFAAILRAKSDAIFIGEETGGTCTGSGLSPIRLTLPYSNFIVEIPLAYIHLSVEGLQEYQLFRGVQPDSVVRSYPGFYFLQGPE